MKKSCYVCLPFGTKRDPWSNAEIDFEAIRQEAVHPAIEGAGLEPIDLRHVDLGAFIHDTTIKVIAESDMMVADLTSTNPNVLYELGIRHALRNTGTVLIADSRMTLPFDLSAIPVVRYVLENGRPQDAEHFRANLTDFIVRRLQSQKTDSPVHRLHAHDVIFTNDLTLLPHQHRRHADRLREFLKTGDYARSVFIMTKFPDGADEAQDERLKRVIRAVVEGIRACRYHPRLASTRDYYDNLWDNVELHLLGCSKGVAIVENKYRPELNPNVAMEWGWMRAMGKSVLFLVEDEFRDLPADWQGLLRKPFHWDRPEEAITKHLKRWLKPDGKPLAEP